jgi:hypothetical protein
MSRKKQSPQTTTGDANRHPLTIGSRVRCTDDGVTGRIVWANGTSVKITWDDGEQVTWRRDSLAQRPLQILAEQPASEQSSQTQPPAATPTLPETAPAQAVPRAAALAQPQRMPATAEQATATDLQVVEPLPAAPEPTEATAAAGGAPAPAPPTKPKRQRQAPTQPKDQKLSALDAAARVLAEAGTPMTCPEMIDAMAAKGYWTSPGGKTPAATLSSALLRELTSKGTQARFVKTGRGKFARNPGA